MERDTRLVHASRDPDGHQGAVNPPLYRASTILYPTLAAYEGRHERRYTAYALGLKSVDDLIADLDAGFARLGAVLRSESGGTA